MQRDFKGVWIPKEIWLDKTLTWMEKLFLTEIDSLVKNGECFASNEYFGKFFDLSKDRASKIISSLAKKGYVEIHLVYKNGTKQIEKRIITTIGYRKKQIESIAGQPIVEINYTPIVESTDTPIGENNEDNNTSFINTNIINNIESVSPPQASPLKSEKKKRKIERIAFAHNVFLTKKKYEELCKLFGKPNVDKKIIAFSKYQDNPSKKTYEPSQHFRTLKNWLDRDGKVNEQFGKTKLQQEEEELERWMRENGHVAN